MATLWWGGAMGLTAAGALLLWGAHILSVETFSIDASILLFLALLFAGLSYL